MKNLRKKPYFAQAKVNLYSCFPRLFSDLIENRRTRLRLMLSSTSMFH